MKQGYLKIMRWFLPVLFISYMAGITLFTHSHVVNGVTIVHSHPFKQGTAHQHSTVELLHIHILSHLIADSATVVFALPLFVSFLLCLLLGRLPHTHFHAPYHGVTALRAPPAICLFAI